MTLLGHFYPPLSNRAPWQGLHAVWATLLSLSINELLPEGCFSLPQVYSEPRIEVDVATWDRSPMTPRHDKLFSLPRAVPLSEWPKRFVS